jgi:hypothetical protein
MIMNESDLDIREGCSRQVGKYIPKVWNFCVLG